MVVEPVADAVVVRVHVARVAPAVGVRVLLTRVPQERAVRAVAHPVAVAVERRREHRLPVDLEEADARVGLHQVAPVRVHGHDLALRAGEAAALVRDRPLLLREQPPPARRPLRITHVPLRRCEGSGFGRPVEGNGPELTAELVDVEARVAGGQSPVEDHRLLVRGDSEGVHALTVSPVGEQREDAVPIVLPHRVAPVHPVGRLSRPDEDR